nr:MAG TPA: hypothetical protein [Caudoviricetes sp.]
MKKAIISGLIILMGLGLFTSTLSTKRTNSIEGITSKILYDDILIKNENLDILYKGKSDFMPENLKNKQVLEVSSCEDTNNTITLIIK